VADLVEDWAAEAARLRWARPFDRVYGGGDGPGRDGRGGEGPGGGWFAGGMLNVADNCLDRHLDERADQPALLWEGEPGDRRRLTYAELHAEVVALAAALTGLGVGPGTRVALHLGMLPETVVAMLACARIGAVHCVLPVPLPPEALAVRLEDLRPRVLLTQDGAWRQGVLLPLKARADEALASGAGVECTVVVRRTGIDVAWYEGDCWYSELIDEARSAAVVPAPAFSSDHPVLVTYHADRGGRPTAIVHGGGGLLVAAAALHRRGLAADASGTYWCAVDLAWLAGQTHGVYGPLVEGATTVLYEGALDTPTRDRCWQLLERYQVAALTTTPSVARSLRQWTDHPPQPSQVATVRRIVTAGEPIEAEVGEWLANAVGGGTAVVANAWGQAELGGIVTVAWPGEGGVGEVRAPDPGMDVVDERGVSLPVGVSGELVLRQPWPATFLGVAGAGNLAADHGRVPGAYATGDAARREADGTIALLGRLDPVVSVAGQLVSASEVRDALVDHPFVVDAAVLDQPDARSGQAVLACVVLTRDAGDAGDVGAQLRHHVHETLGGLATPRTVVVVESLPSDVPRRVLRRALRMATAADSSDTLLMSQRQLSAALVAARHDPAE